MSVEEFVSRVLNRNKSQTQSASTPYRQFKRHHSTQVPSEFLFQSWGILPCNTKVLFSRSRLTREAAG